MTRDELIRLMAIAVHGPPCPEQATAGLSGRTALRAPTADEWAAHVLEHAKALGRLLDAEDRSVDARREPTLDPDSDLSHAWPRLARSIRAGTMTARAAADEIRAYYAPSKPAGIDVDCMKELEQLAAAERAVVGVAAERMAPGVSKDAVVMPLPCGGMLVGIDPRMPLDDLREAVCKAISPTVATSEPSAPTCDHCGAEHDTPDYGTGDGCTQW